QRWTVSWAAGGTSPMALGVNPPPHSLSRGNLARSNSNTRAPRSARCRAAVDPAGPAPTMIASGLLLIREEYSHQAREAGADGSIGVGRFVGQRGLRDQSGHVGEDRGKPVACAA